MIADFMFKTAVHMERRKGKLSSKVLDIEGCKISYLTGGKGETILMIHGFGSSKDNWVRFAHHITPYYQTIIPDLPGHGESCHSLEENYDIPSQVERLDEFVNKLGLSTFHIIGISMGGAIAMRYSHRYPDKVKSLGLINSAGIMAPKKSEFLQLLEEGKNPLLVKKPEDLAVLYDFVMAKPLRLPGFASKAITKKYLSRIEINQKIFDDIQAESILCMDILSEIKVPTFILAGKLDRIFDVSGVEIFQKNIPHNKVFILDEVGHVPILEAPRRSASHYIETLKGFSEVA